MRGILSVVVATILLIGCAGLDGRTSSEVTADSLLNRMETAMAIDFAIAVGDVQQSFWLRNQRNRAVLAGADLIIEERGALDPHTKVVVEGVLNDIVKSISDDLNSPSMAPDPGRYLMVNCDLCHAYLILGKPKEALRQLRPVFRFLQSYTWQMGSRPPYLNLQVRAKYFLARTFVALYRGTKATEIRPPKIRKMVDGRPAIVELSRKEALKYYLVKAYNICRFELQEKYYRDHPLAKRALKEIHDLHPILKAEGLDPPECPISRRKSDPVDRFLALYMEKRYEQAIEFYQQKLGSSNSLDGDSRNMLRFAMVICHTRVEGYQKAEETAVELLKESPNSEYTRDAIAYLFRSVQYKQRLKEAHSQHDEVLEPISKRMAGLLQKHYPRYYAETFGKDK